MKNVSIATAPSAFLIALNLFTGCGKEASTKTHAREGGEQPHSLVITTQTPSASALSPWDVLPAQRLSNLQPHAPVLRINGGLTPGRTYKATFSLKNPEGKEAPVLNGSMEFTPQMSQYAIWYPYTPPFERRTPGKWTWTVGVDCGIGTFSQSVVVEPLTPAEEPELVLHEQARESVLRAFANYWVSVDGDYFSMIIARTRGADTQNAHIQTRLDGLQRRISELQNERDISADEAKVAAEGKTGFDAALAARRPEFLNREVRNVSAIDLDLQRRGKEYEEIQKQRLSPTDTYYVQFKGLTHRSLRAPLTEADRLNGFTYSGSMNFGFRLYRYYRLDSGWTDWRDVVRVPEIMAGIVANTAGALLASDMFPNLRFSVVQKDGHWRVTSDSNDLFVDGHKIERPAKDEEERNSVLARESQIRTEEQGLAVKLSITRPANPEGIRHRQRWIERLQELRTEIAEIEQKKKAWADETPAVLSVLPRADVIAEFLKSGKTPRDDDKALAEWVRTHPKELEDQVKKTMASARGRGL